jgi:hypothetical protein
MAWTWSTTTLAWPSGATSALAYPLQGPARPCPAPGPASRAAGPEASRHGGPGAVGHQVQQPAALQVDQTGDPSGRRRRGCPKNARLVQAEGRPPLQTSSAVHQRGAVVSHRLHHGRPANPEVTRDRGHGVGVLADPPTVLSAGPPGPAPPWNGSGPPARSRCAPAGWLTTAPDPLAQASTTGRPPTEQVAHPDRTAAVELGPYPRPLHPTAVAVVWTASRHSPPATAGGEDLEAVQAEQPGRRHTPVVGPAGASCLADVTHPQAMRGLRCCSGRSYIAGSSTPPHAS